MTPPVTARATTTRELLFHAAAALDFPRLPIRPAVAVIAGREAWSTFTTNGTAEDLTAARIAIEIRTHAEKAQRASLKADTTESAPVALAHVEKAQRTRRCAFCGDSLAGRRRHARHCSARCRAAASDARRQSAQRAVR